MSRREDIDTAIWEDEDFDDLSDDAAFLYLWSFTNYRCGMGGIYQVKARSICEGRMTPARRTAALEELRAANFVHYIDGWLWVRSRVKHLRTRGEKIATAVIRDLGRVPADNPVRAAFLSEYLKNSWVSKWLVQAEFEDPSIGHPHPIDGVQGKGKGKGSVAVVEESPTSEPSRDDEWADWLSHYQQATGRTAVTGSAEARKAFNARREEGVSVEDLMAATVGCHGDPYLREKKFDRPETILRPSNFRRYIELAKDRRGATVHPIRPPAGMERPPELEATWAEAGARLRAAVPDSTFKIWLEPLQLAGSAEGVVYLAAPEGIATWVERRYSSLLREAIGGAEIRFVPAEAEAAA